MIRRVVIGAVALSLFGGAMLFESALVDAEPSPTDVEQKVVPIKEGPGGIIADGDCEFEWDREGHNEWGYGPPPPWFIGKWTESPSRCVPVLDCDIFWQLPRAKEIQVIELADAPFPEFPCEPPCDDLGQYYPRLCCNVILPIDDSRSEDRLTPINPCLPPPCELPAIEVRDNLSPVICLPDAT